MKNMTKERQNTKNHKGLVAVSVAFLAMAGLIAAMEFVPQSPFAGMIQRWSAGAQQPAQEAAYPGNPANDGRSEALQQWLDSKQPEITTVEPSSFDPATDDEAPGTGSDDVDSDADGITKEDGTAGDASTGASSESSGTGTSGSSTSGSSSTSGTAGSSASSEGAVSSSGSAGGSSTGTGSSSSSGSSGSSGSSSSSSVTGDSGSSSTAHTHTTDVRKVIEEADVIEHVEGHWETVHHDAVYNDWDEGFVVCNRCGAMYKTTDEMTVHLKAEHLGDGSDVTGWHSHTEYHHDLVSEAYDEEVWVEAHDEVVGHRTFIVYETYCTECGEVLSREDPWA